MTRNNKKRGKKTQIFHVEAKKGKKIQTKGLIFLGSLPSFFIASLMQARSTTAGTPVKSWSRNEKFKTKCSFFHSKTISTNTIRKSNKKPAEEHEQA